MWSEKLMGIYVIRDYNIPLIVNMETQSDDADKNKDKRVACMLKLLTKWHTIILYFPKKTQSVSIFL